MNKKIKREISIMSKKSKDIKSQKPRGTLIPPHKIHKSKKDYNRKREKMIPDDILENQKTIAVCGDIHGQWENLNNFIKYTEADIILQCGDFGWFPNLQYNGWDQYGLENGDTKIYFCDGNHDNHQSLRNLENNEIMKNVFYMKRGSILNINNKNILFMGGADSIDKNLRTNGLDWWPEEIITKEDVNNLPEEKVDIVISHTCPYEFKIFLFGSNDPYIDPSRDALSYVLKKYKPKQWFFSHWHQWQRGKYQDCEWLMLNKSPDVHWWTELRI